MTEADNDLFPSKTPNRKAVKLSNIILHLSCTSVSCTSLPDDSADPVVITFPCIGSCLCET